MRKPAKASSYDIGRTPLVECRIDTGAHRPIRQPLRRQPFEYEQVSNMAKKYKWKVRPTQLKNVKATNGENMTIEGVVNEIFAFGKRSVRADVYLNDLILGVDWLGKQGRMEWDFDTQRIHFGDGEWLALQHEKGTSLRRIYVGSEVVLPPKQESVVPVRVERGSRWAWPYEAVTETTKAACESSVDANYNATTYESVV